MSRSTASLSHGASDGSGRPDVPGWSTVSGDCEFTPRWSGTARELDELVDFFARRAACHQRERDAHAARMRVGETGDINTGAGIQSYDVSRGARLVFECSEQHRFGLLGAIDANRGLLMGVQPEI